MTIENITINNSEDLYNEDNRRRILESGSEEELERLQKFFGNSKSPNEFKVLEGYIKLRKKTLQEMQEELKIRKETNPRATEEELAMGAYIEDIEPQVREAVINLRRKGYNTRLSGFDEENQRIDFDEEYPIFGKQWFENLKIDGIELEIKQGHILFTCKRLFTIEELKNIWDKLTEAAPDLKRSARPCSLLQAKLFRDKQSELNN